MNKLKPFLEDYRKGYIIYENGALYRTVKWVGLKEGGSKLIVLDNPEKMRTKLGEKNNGRYYRINRRKVSAYEHVVIYAIHHGLEELSKWENLDHIDGNRNNNRIENLEGVSIEENNRRLIEKNLLRPRYGADNGMSKTTEEEVREIRLKYKETNLTQYELADIYNMTQGHISDIVNHKKWGHVK